MRKFILSFAYIGFLPGAPGTYASIVAFAIFCVGTHLGAPCWVWPVFAVIAALALLLVGVPADSSGDDDPKWCVLDEVAGAFVTVIAQPATDTPLHLLLTAALALAFFRLFDILKPPPINLLERLAGTWGVLADDLGAGVLANICTRLLRRFVFGI